MTVDYDIKRHQDGWNGFTRFVQYSAIGTAVLLVLLAWLLV